MRPLWFALLVALVLVAAGPGAEAVRRKIPSRGRNRYSYPGGSRHSVRTPVVPDIQPLTTFDFDKAFKPLRDWFHQFEESVPRNPIRGTPSQGNPEQPWGWVWNWFQTPDLPQDRPTPRSDVRSRAGPDGQTRPGGAGLGRFTGTEEIDSSPIIVGRGGEDWTVGRRRDDRVSRPLPPVDDSLTHRRPTNTMRHPPSNANSWWEQRFRPISNTRPDRWGMSRGNPHTRPDRNQWPWERQGSSFGSWLSGIFGSGGPGASGAGISEGNSWHRPGNPWNSGGAGGRGTSGSSWMHGGGGGGGRGGGGGGGHSGFTWGHGTSVGDGGNDGRWIGWTWSYDGRLPSVPRFDFDDFRNNFFQMQHHHSSPFFINHHHHHGHHHGNSGWQPSQPSQDPVGDESSSYETLCRGRHYTARRYKKSVWISAAVNGSSVEALRRIKGYFTGENEQGLYLEMTRPLRMTVSTHNDTISDTEDTVKSFVLSAMIPSHAQGSPPAPLDETLNITVEPPQVYFSTHFRPIRRPGSPSIYDEFFELRDALETAGEMSEGSSFHTAFYETWAEFVQGVYAPTPRPGEILIPAANESNLMCRPSSPGATGRQEPQNGIEQCGDSRCPEYEHLEQVTEGVELRRMRGGTLLTRTAPACSMILPAFVAHNAFKRYLAGANVERREYSRPAPFLHYMYPSPSATSFCKQTATSAYMLPSNTAAAQPTDSTLRIRTLRDKEVFVMKFGGRPTPRTIEERVDQLRGILRREGRCFVPHKYMVAVYDHPFNRPPHLNEVMVFQTAGPCGEDDHFHDVSESTPTTTTATTASELPQRRTTTRTTRTETEFPPVIELDLSLESNSVEMDTDLIPYRFTGNYTDFPEDFPTDVFVF